MQEAPETLIFSPQFRAFSISLASEAKVAVAIANSGPTPIGHIAAERRVAGGETGIGGDAGRRAQGFRQWVVTIGWELTPVSVGVGLHDFARQDGYFHRIVMGADRVQIVNMAHQRRIALALQAGKFAPPGFSAEPWPMFPPPCPPSLDSPPARSG